MDGDADVQGVGRGGRTLGGSENTIRISHKKSRRGRSSEMHVLRFEIGQVTCIFLSSLFIHSPGSTRHSLQSVPSCLQTHPARYRTSDRPCHGTACLPTQDHSVRSHLLRTLWGSLSILQELKQQTNRQAMLVLHRFRSIMFLSESINILRLCALTFDKILVNSFAQSFDICSMDQKL